MTVEQLYQYLKEIRKVKGAGNKNIECWLPGTYIELSIACFSEKRNAYLLEGNVKEGGF